MRPQAIRKALDAYAQRNMAGTPDLGPAVRQSLAGRAVTDGRIHVESPGRRMGLLVPAGLLVLLLAAFVLVPLLRPAARQLPAAAPAAGLASGGLGSPNSGAATQDPTTNEAAYVDQLTHNLAIRLGTDEAHLNAAFQAAAQETLDQAVRDGKLPANQATTAKALAAKGLAGVLVTMFQDAGGKDVGTSRAMEAAYGAIVPAVSALFGLTAEQFAAAIEGGQTLQTLKAAHGTSDQQVRDAAMAGVRTALANGVQAGQWTNAEADTAAHMLEANLDNVLLKLTSAGAPQSKDDIQQIVTAAIENSVPPLLGMAPDDFWGAIKQGHSLHELAVAHNISDSQMHDTALAAARAALAQGVEKGQWTQAQSDGLSPNLSTMVDKVLGALSPKRDGPSGAQAPPK